MKSAIVFALVCSTVSFAAPLLTEPVAELHLASGKVLHDAQAKGFLARSVLVKHSGGAETVAYEEFPAQYQTQLMAKRPAPSAVSTVPQPTRSAPAVKALPATSAKTTPEAAAAPVAGVEVPSAVSLVTHRIESAYITVELHNSANTPTEVRCSSVQAETTTGAVLKGRQWVAAEIPNMISGMLGTKQVIAENASASLKVVFDPLPAGATISRVFLTNAAK